MAQKSIRALTDDENKFNRYIKKYENYIDFTATEFDYSDTVKKLFSIYMTKLQKNYDLELKRELRKYSLNRDEEKIEIPAGISDELRQDLLEFEKSRVESDFKITDNFTNNKYTVDVEKDEDGLVVSKHINEVKDGYTIQNILRITNLPLATTLYHPIYIDLEPNQLADDIDNSKEALRQKIKDWHNYNFGLNRAKDFIEKLYPSWGSKSKKQKEPARKKLYELIEQLQVFEIDEYYLNAMKDILDTEIGLNQLAELKAKKLLTLKLPNISSQKMAEKILKHYEEPTHLL